MAFLLARSLNYGGPAGGGQTLASLGRAYDTTTPKRGVEGRRSSNDTRHLRLVAGSAGGRQLGPPADRLKWLIIYENRAVGGVALDNFPGTRRTQRLPRLRRDRLLALRFSDILPASFRDRAFCRIRKRGACGDNQKTAPAGTSCCPASAILGDPRSGSPAADERRP